MGGFWMGGFWMGGFWMGGFRYGGYQLISFTYPSRHSGSDLGEWTEINMNLIKTYSILFAIIGLMEKGGDFLF